MRKELLRIKRQESPRSKRTPNVPLILVFFIVLGVLGALIYILTRTEGQSNMIVEEKYSSPRTPASSQRKLDHPIQVENPGQLQKLVAKSRRSLVFIQAENSPVSVNEGSGFIATRNGYILTNHHVIEGSYAISIRLDAGVQKSADVVYSDELNDLALLKIEGERYTPLTLGDSYRVSVGEQILVMGYPLGSELGREPTVGQGIISSIRGNGEIFQCDVATNKGNSGGPVISIEKGEVIGIINAKLMTYENENVEGISFCVPINKAKRLLENIGKDPY
jgi:S1-C subfamily serine protease